MFDGLGLRRRFRLRSNLIGSPNTLRLKALEPSVDHQVNSFVNPFQFLIQLLTSMDSLIVIVCVFFGTSTFVMILTKKNIMAKCKSGCGTFLPIIVGTFLSMPSANNDVAELARAVAIIAEELSYKLNTRERNSQGEPCTLSLS